tara:strand:+ start:53 stop:247 length:195 start_codon:yes stop_codon:yes gene_type:complete
MQSLPRPRPNVLSRRFIKDSRKTLNRIQKFIDNEESRQNKTGETTTSEEPEVLIAEPVPVRVDK